MTLQLRGGASNSGGAATQVKGDRERGTLIQDTGAVHCPRLVRNNSSGHLSSGGGLGGDLSIISSGAVHRGVSKENVGGVRASHADGRHHHLQGTRRASVAASFFFFVIALGRFF